MDREALTKAFDALDAALDGVTGLDFGALTTREWLAFLERCERARRRLPATEHQLINHLARQSTPEELGGKLSHAVAEWTLIAAPSSPAHPRGPVPRRVAEVLTARADCSQDGPAPPQHASEAGPTVVPVRPASNAAPACPRSVARREPRSYGTAKTAPSIAPAAATSAGRTDRIGDLFQAAGARGCRYRRQARILQGRRPSGSQDRRCKPVMAILDRQEYTSAQRWPRAA